MRNIALRLTYDGSAYHGWQVQKTEVTVAETLEKAGMVQFSDIKGTQKNYLADTTTPPTTEWK